MISMRHDLRDAIDELHPEATVAVVTEEQRCGDDRVCRKCGFPAASKHKLRCYGRCASIHYCSKQCAKEHWAEHKLVCASLRKAGAKALAYYEARGGRIQDYNQIQRDVVSWFQAVPGLINEIAFLA